jgi:DNA repair exonuclease SbcCD ATPase subunit
MATHKTVNDSPTGRHAHRPSIAIDEATERCPLCGQPVPQIQYIALQKKLEARVQAGLEEAEKTLRDKFAREQQQAIAKARAEVEKAKKDADAQVEKAKREAAAREAVVRQQATKAAAATGQIVKPGAHWWLQTDAAYRGAMPEMRCTLASRQHTGPEAVGRRATL